MIKSAEQDSGLYTFTMLGFGVYRFHSFDTAMHFFIRTKESAIVTHILQKAFFKHTLEW